MPALLAILCGAWLVIDGDRRRSLFVLAGMFLSAAGVMASGPGVGFALVTLLAGFVASLVLWMTASGEGWVLAPEGIRIPSGRVFRLLATILVTVAAAGFSRANLIGLPIQPPGTVTASMVLIGLGVLQTGLSEEPLRVGLGLLTMLAGFDLSYSAIEPSVAVMALMASAEVGVALVVSYLLTLTSSARPRSGLH
jgi:hypothetical protein